MALKLHRAGVARALGQRRYGSANYLEHRGQVQMPINQQSVVFGVLAALILAATACGSEPSEGTQNGEAPDLSEGRIVVTTDAGTVVEFDDFKVTCPGDSEDQWGQEARVVQATAGAYGTAAQAEQDAIRLTAGEGVKGRYEFPYEETYGEYETFVTAFAPTAAETTELTAASEGASGTIEILAASCDPTPRIELKIDGKLVSETGNGTGTIKGHLKLQ